MPKDKDPEYIRLKKKKQVEATQRWRAKQKLENPNFMAEQRAKHNARVDANRDRYRQLWRDSYARNRPAKLVAAKVKRERNREYYKRLSKEWRVKNPERSKFLMERWRSNNVQQRRLLNRSYQARKNNANGKSTQQQLEDRILYYGTRCVYCSGDFECLDHAVPLANGGTNWPSNIYPACISCNSRKRNKSLHSFLVQLQKENTLSNCVIAYLLREIPNDPEAAKINNHVR